MPLCAVCGSTMRWCDCQIAKMSPAQRVASQTVIVAAYEAALDQREFERRRVAQPLRRTVRGQFGNVKAADRRGAA